jgi:hypothetical protein
MLSCHAELLRDFRHVIPAHEFASATPTAIPATLGEATPTMDETSGTAVKVGNMEHLDPSIAYCTTSIPM